MQFIVNKKTAWFCDMTALYATRRGSAKELYGCAEDGSATLALRHAWLRWKQQWIGRQMRVYRSLTPTQVNRHFKHHFCLKRGQLSGVASLRVCTLGCGAKTKLSPAPDSNTTLFNHLNHEKEYASLQLIKTKRSQTAENKSGTQYSQLNVKQSLARGAQSRRCACARCCYKRLAL